LTPVQQLLRNASLSSSRNFSTSTKASATTAEAQPPTASQAPGISNSSLLLRTIDKDAKSTPGLKWTKEDDRSGESRKMNMYTVRSSSVVSESASASVGLSASASAGRMASYASFSQQQQQPSFASSRSFSTSSKSASSASAASVSSIDKIPSSNLPPTLTSLERSSTSAKTLQKRVYPERKRFLVEQYSRLLDESSVVLVLQHGNLSVGELSKMRSEIKSVEIPGASAAEGTEGATEIRRKAKFTMVRSGLMSPILKSHPNKNVKSLKPIFTGPIALITIPSPSNSSDGFSPKYISSLISILDKALGLRKGMSGKYDLKDGSVTSNPRLVLLAAMVLNGNVRDLTKAEKRVTNSKLGTSSWTERNARVLNVNALRDASKLPELETLRAQIIGLLSSPASQLMGVLSQASGMNLAMTLEARKRDLEEKKKE